MAATMFCPWTLSSCHALMCSSQSTQQSLILRRTSICLRASGLHAAATETTQARCHSVQKYRFTLCSKMDYINVIRNSEKKLSACLTVYATNDFLAYVVCQVAFITVHSCLGAITKLALRLTLSLTLSPSLDRYFKFPGGELQRQQTFFV